MTPIESQFDNYLHSYLRGSSTLHPNEKASLFNMLKNLYSQHRIILITSSNICIREFICNYKDLLES